MRSQIWSCYDLICLLYFPLGMRGKNGIELEFKPLS